VLIRSQSMTSGIALGDRQSFADVGATLAEFFGVSGVVEGVSFVSDLGLPDRISP